MRFVRATNEFVNVVTGSVATVDLPVDRRYHNVVLEYKRDGALATWAQIKADIALIEIELNGIVQRSIKPAQLEAMHAFRGHVDQDGYVTLHFSEWWARLPDGEDGQAWNVRGNVRTFQIKVTLNAGAHTVALKAFHQHDGGIVNGGAVPFKSAKRYISQTVPVSAVGVFTLTQLPRDGLFKSFYCFETADGDIERVRITVDSVEVYDMTRDQAEAMLPRDGVKQAGVFPVIFDVQNRLSDGLLTRNNQGGVLNIRTEFTMGAANPFDMVAEYLAPPLS